jgi:hypothetical protein
MKLLPFCLIFALCLAQMAYAQAPASWDTTWQPFAPGIISLPDIRETSPSMKQRGDG